MKNVYIEGIVDYQEKSEDYYNRKWDAFYGSMRRITGLDFSMKQLMDKVKNLKKRLRDNQPRANDGNILSFTNTDDEKLFELSKIIWAEKETECAYEENKDQTKVDVPCERVVSNANTEIDNGEKEKSEEDGVDDFCVTKDALEAATSFQSLRENLHNFLLRNLKNAGANQRKELTDEWKALLAEKMQLDIKFRTFFAKLVNVGFSA